MTAFFHFVPIVLPILLMCALVFGIVYLPIWLAASIVRRASGEKTVDRDEAQLMQEIHRGLTRVDERLTLLEALVLDTDPKKELDT